MQAKGPFRIREHHVKNWNAGSCDILGRDEAGNEVLIAECWWDKYGENRCDRDEAQARASYLLELLNEGK